MSSIKGANYRYMQEIFTSGGGQFTCEGLDEILNECPDNRDTVVIDLRQECHGFLNGVPITLWSKYHWGNKEKTNEQIKHCENDFLDKIAQSQKIMRQQSDDSENEVLKNSCDEEVVIKSVISEEFLCAQKNIPYYRIYVTDHCGPSNEAVSAFLDLLPKIQNLRKHIHCRGGRGRTTTFMTIICIITYSKIMSFEEIIALQIEFKGVDLSDFDVSDSFKHEPRKERYKFLKRFYDFVQTHPEPTSEAWNDFIKNIEVKGVCQS